MSHPSSPIDQFRRLWPRLFLALLPCFLVGLIVALAYPTAGISYYEFFEDIYEAADSRWSGFVTYMACLAWSVAATVCLFSAYFLQGDNRPQVKAWRTFFICSGAFSTMLLFDDLMGLHELGDDIFMLVTKREDEVDWGGKQMLESIFFLAYGILFSNLLWRFRKLIYSTEYIFLAASILFFMLSIGLDVTHTWKFAYLFEEFFKLSGILLYSFYFIRTSKQAILTLCKLF